MIEISKGDIVFEPAELLFRFLARVTGRILGNSMPTDSTSQWGWIDWIGLIAVLAALVYLVRRFRNRGEESGS